MARGDFAKGFSEHRKNGGTLTRKEFADTVWKNREKKAEDENLALASIDEEVQP